MVQIKSFSSVHYLSHVSLCALGAAFLYCAPAHAAGFYIQEQSVSGLGNAFAGQVATPRDSSVVYFNPAGMTHLKGTHMHLGVHLISPSADLTNTGSVIPFGGATGGDGGNPYEATPVPNISISHEVLEDRFWLGLSVSAPFGLSNEYEKGWFGRFDSTETNLTTTDIQPSFAYKLCDKLSIGGGINIQYVDANLEKVINQTGPGGERVSVLNGDDTSLGFNVGVLYQPVESTTVGVHYRSAVHHNLEGRVSTKTLGGTLLGSSTATAELGLPDIAQFGVNHKINDKLSLQASATWFGWNSFNEIRVKDRASGTTLPGGVTEQHYQTTWAFAVGGEYELNEKWTLRAGYQYDQTPTRDEFRSSITPDGDRQWIATGATYKINDKYSLDLAATYIDIASETINVSRNGGLATVSADTGGHVAILAMGVNYKF